MSDCLFCRIIAGEIPSSCVYEDENVFAFRDINPQAPVHVLVIPKEHIESVDALNADNIGCAANCLAAIPGIAKAEGLAGGYRVISNCGGDAGQTVKHLHFHVIGGRRLDDKMA